MAVMPSCIVALSLKECEASLRRRQSLFGLLPSVGGLGVRASDVVAPLGDLGPDWAPSLVTRQARRRQNPGRCGGFVNSGGGIRTRDLRVMSPGQEIALDRFRAPTVSAKTLT